MFTRRTVLSTIVAVQALVLGAPALLAQPAGAIGGIRVELSPLVLQGWGANAGAIKAAFERELYAGLNGNIRRGGPLLVVSVRQIFLNSYAGGGGGSRFGGDGSAAGSDSLESEAVLLGPGNRVIASYPVLSTVSATSAGPWYLPDIDQRRIAGLIRHNAAWIKRYVAG